MKLSRKNYALAAVCGFMLSVAAGAVMMFDDRANAAGKGVDLREPVACERQLPTGGFETDPTGWFGSVYTDSIRSSIESASGAFYSHIPTDAFSTSSANILEEAC